MDNKSVEFEVLKYKLEDYFYSRNKNELDEEKQVLSSNELSKAIHNMYLHQNCYLPTQDMVWRKGLLGKLEYVIKKIAKKVMRWYLNNLCQEQTYFNQSTLAALTYADHNIYYVQSMINNYEKRINRLENEIEMLNKTIEEMKMNEIK